MTIGDKKKIISHISNEIYNSLSKNKVQVNIPIHQQDNFRIANEKTIDVEQEIFKKLNDADEQVKIIISEAYKDSKLIYQNAKSEGYNEGYSEGYEDGKQKAENIIQEALSIKKDIIDSKESIIKDLENKIIELVLDTAEKVVYSKLEESRDSILGLIRLGLEKCTYTESLVLRICPEDYDYVMSVKDRILCLAENIEDIYIKKDASLKKGSCILDTVSGSIDSSVQAQFVHIHSTFQQLLGNE